MLRIMQVSVVRRSSRHSHPRFIAKERAALVCRPFKLDSYRERPLQRYCMLASRSRAVLFWHDLSNYLAIDAMAQ